MPTIPPELLPILQQLGIVDPAGSKWKKLDPWPIRRMRSHYFCECGTRPDGEQRAELRSTILKGRAVFIGQCRWCRVIYWRDAVKGD